MEALRTPVVEGFLPGVGTGDIVLSRRGALIQEVKK